MCERRCYSGWTPFCQIVMGDAQVDVAGKIAVASPLSSFCRLQVAAVPFARVMMYSTNLKIST
jgi:hypothetical protein